jgi:uncharacterized protein YdeI (YjbR/CyaY-like superfamily)
MKKSTYVPRIIQTDADLYLKDGCGRCDHYQTPQCKVLLWTPILTAMRALLIEAGLGETMKWGQPCYTIDDKNVAMMVSMRDYAGLSFFQGGALDDPKELLVSPGPNSQYGRYLKFTTLREFQARKADTLKLLQQAIDLEKRGIKFKPEKKEVALPEELQAALQKNPKLKKAFDALTPGRQRSHIIHISGAKQADTRVRRVEKCAEDILEGRGFNERV